MLDNFARTTPRISLRWSSSVWGSAERAWPPHTPSAWSKYQGRGLLYLLAVLCLLHLAHVVGDLNRLDGILVIHVGVQVAQLLLGLLDLNIQLVYLPLQAWGGTAWGRQGQLTGQMSGPSFQGPSQETPETQLSLASGLGSGLTCVHNKAGGGKS